MSLMPPPTVWVTRDESIDGPLCWALKTVGLTPILAPVIRRVPRPQAREALAAAAPSDLVLFTSPFAIEVVGAPQSCRRAAVVGVSTAKAATSLGYEVVVASVGGLSRLISAINQEPKAQTIWHPCSDVAEVISPIPGAAVMRVHAYDTHPIAWDASAVQTVNMIAVASPSAVRAIGFRRQPFASIGPTTSQAIRMLGIEPAMEAEEASFESLANAIADYFIDSRHQRA